MAALNYTVHGRVAVLSMINAPVKRSRHVLV